MDIHLGMRYVIPWEGPEEHMPHHASAIRTGIVALALAGGCGTSETRPKPAPEPAPAMPVPAAAARAGTLYERLGGAGAIAAVVDDLLARIMADPVLAARFDGANVPRIRDGLVAILGQAAGGPERYRGRPMKEVHAGMEVTDAEFDALAGDLAAALEARGGGAREKAEVLAAVGTLRREIVAPKTSVEDRLARVERDLARIEAKLDRVASRLERPAPPPRPGAPVAEAAAGPGPAAPPRKGPPLHAQPWTPAEKNFARSLVERYTRAAAVSAGEPHDELIGGPLPLTRFLDSAGRVLDLRDLEGKKVVLVILRGFAGTVCLHCSSQTIALARAAAKFKERGAEVILVYPGAAESVPAFIEAVRNLEEGFTPPFPIVLDVDLAAVRTFRIEGSLAKPTSLILDERGIVRYAYVGRQPADRPSVDVLIDAIDRIGKGTP